MKANERSGSDEEIHALSCLRLRTETKHLKFEDQSFSSTFIRSWEEQVSLNLLAIVRRCSY